jgi:hypothetical protein
MENLLRIVRLEGYGRFGYFIFGKILEKHIKFFFFVHTYLILKGFWHA